MKEREREKVECVCVRFSSRARYFADYPRQARRLNSPNPCFLISVFYCLARSSIPPGNALEDERTSLLIQALVNSKEIDEACPIPFDEGRMWKGEGGSILFEELQTSFRNISAIMDCVGCDKCKVWGKLQVSGLATAIKILFT